MEKKSGIVKSTSYVMIVLVVVKIIGFLKQAVIAAYFGTSIDMDLYLIASDFITEVGTVFFSSLSVNFLTMFVQLLVKKGKKEADVLLSNTLIFFIPVAVAIIMVIWIFTDPISALIASGYGAAQRKIVGKYIRIVSIVIINICISNICTAVLEGEKIFLPGKFVGIIQSVCLVIACVGFSGQHGIYSILYGIIAYYIIQNIFLLYFVFRDNKFCVRQFWKDKRVVELVKLCLPLFISNAVVQINIIVDKSIASHLESGSVAALSYSNFLFQAVHSIVIGSLCTVVFSYFSTYVATKEHNKIVDILRKGTADLLLLLLPLSVVFLVNAETIVRVIYARGAFDEKSVTATTYAFIGYTIGIIFVTVRDLLVRAHYAFQDTKRPMLNGMLGVVINIVLSAILANYVGVFGIAVADSVSYFVVLLLAMKTIKKHLNNYKLFGGWEVPLKMAVAAILSAFAGIAVKQCVYGLGDILCGALNGAATVLVFFGILLCTRCSAALELWSMLKRKFGKKSA